MAKLRVHELAKKLGLTNQETLERLHEGGLSVKTHSSTVDEDEARKVLATSRRGGGDPNRMTERDEIAHRIIADRSSNRAAATRREAPTAVGVRIERTVVVVLGVDKAALTAAAVKFSALPDVMQDLVAALDPTDLFTLAACFAFTSEGVRAVNAKLETTVEMDRLVRDGRFLVLLLDVAPSYLDDVTELLERVSVEIGNGTTAFGSAAWFSGVASRPATERPRVCAVLEENSVPWPKDEPVINGGRASAAAIEKGDPATGSVVALKGRRVFVDGANIALAAKVRRMATIEAVLRALTSAGAVQDNIDVIFDSSFRRHIRGTADEGAFLDGQSAGRWRQAPSGTIADSVILERLVRDKTAVVVSNDRFRDAPQRTAAAANARRLRVDVSPRDILLYFPDEWDLPPVAESV